MSSLTRSQRLAIVALVLAGLLGTGAVLITGRPAAGDDAQGHDAEHGTDPVTTRGTHGTHGDQGSQPASTHPPSAHAADRVAMSPAQAQAAGIALQPAGPGTLQPSVPFPGEIRFNEDRTAHVVPRLAGVAEAVPAALGQAVRAGEVLAVIASTALAEQRSELLTALRRRDAARVTYQREKSLWEQQIAAQQDYLQAQTALQEADIAVQNAQQKLAAVGAPPPATGGAPRGPLNRFEIRAPFAGTVVAKHLTLGESVKEDVAIFTVADLSTVWAEFVVAPKDLPTVRVGQPVVVSSSAFDGQARGTVSYVGALLGEQTRTARARVTLANPQGAWRPGLFVTVAVGGEAQGAALALPADAVQQLAGRPTVFVAGPQGFEARPVQTGRSDGRTVEVLGGLQAGEQVAVSNTFVLKSELGKAGAVHGH